MCKKLLYVRENALKIPINTGNFTKKKIHFHAFSTIFLGYNQIIKDSLKVLKNLLLVRSRSQMFYKIGIPKYSGAANGGAL